MTPPEWLQLQAWVLGFVLNWSCLESLNFPKVILIDIIHNLFDHSDHFILSA